MNSHSVHGSAAPLISCSYCGRDNDEAATRCRECGSELRPSAAPQNSPETRLSPQSRSAIKSGAGVVLISTAVYYASLRIFFDLMEISHGGPIGKPGIYADGILFLPLALLWALGSLIFTLVVFHRRCPEGWRGLVAAIVTLLVLAMLLTSPGLGFCLPAFLLGKATGSSIIGHVGSAIQLALGGWLLGWFNRWLRRNEQKVV